MHHMIYERYGEWVQLSPDQMPDVLTGYAQELGLNTTQFRRDLTNGTFRTKVQAHYQDAVRMGLPGTPTFIVNGRMYPADQWGLSEQGIDVFVRLATLQRYDSPPPQVIDPGKQYIATIRTEKGDIVIELYVDQAPNSVNTFVFLARDGWYDNTSFFRVIQGFVAQAGDPTATAVGNPGFQCDEEISPDLAFDDAGVVGIASAGPGTNTGGSQFFITLAPQPDLTGNYTIIGKVIAGLDVLQSLTPRDPSDPQAPPGDRIETILIEER
jgi:cyclophilin family peptidyl-prolyl cis-trans isomerase